MNSFKELMALRRSMRKFTDTPLTEEQKRTLLRAALISPTAKNNRGWEFVAVSDKDMLCKLSECKDTGAGFLNEATYAVVVLGNPEVNDCWVEDCSIAAIDMQLQAEDLGLGSCWCHVRGRADVNGTPAKEIIAQLLGIPVQYEPLCIIGFGYKNMERKPYDDDKIEWNKVHYDKF